jgi:hypothetical protein
MFITRFWGSAAVLLYSLLLQNCQLHSVRAAEEERPAVDPSSASVMRQRASGEPPAMRSLTLPGASPTAPVSPSRFSAISAHRQDLSTALSSPATMGSSLAARCDLPAVKMPGASHPLSLSARSTLATAGNSPTAPCDLPVAEMLTTSRAVPLGNKPGASALVFTASSGEHVRFIQIDGQWRAVRQAGYGAATLQNTLPVVGPADVSNFLPWLRGQDQETSRACIHILRMPQAPYGPCVHLSRTGLSGRRPAFSGQGVGQGSCTASRMIFGAKEWRHYYGEVGEEPALPYDIEATLDAPCSFWEGSAVGETHLLVLIPTKVDEVPFTLNLLKELIERPKNGGHRTQYSYYDSRVQTHIGAASPQASYWLLMTYDVLPDSRNKKYADQKRLVTDHARRTDLPYELPSALEAATAILMHHVRDGEQLYREHPLTFIRCRDLMPYKSREYPAVVGGFGFSGLYVQNPFTCIGGHSRGVAGCRKFCVAEGSKTASADKQSLSTALSCRSLGSSAPSTSTLATVGNFSTAPCDLPVAEILTASRVELSDDESGHARAPDDLWWSSIEGLDELEEISLAEIAEAFIDEEETSKQPAKRRSSDPEDDLANKKVRYKEGSESDEVVELPAFWDPVAQHDQTFDDVANASPDTFCSPQIATQKAVQEKTKEQLQSKIDLPSRQYKYQGQQLQSFSTPTESFGASAWQQYFGDVGRAPDLPNNIAGILDSACPFWPERKIRDTHLLVLIPATVDGAPFTLSLLGELVKRPKNGGHKTQYSYYDSRVQARLGAASPQASYWLLMTRDVLPWSRRKTYADHKKLVADHARRTSLPYELPKALEAATAILTHHVRNGEQLYGDNPWTFTRCQERIVRESNRHPVVVGGFESSGPDIYSSCCSRRCHDGAACCRKLF